MQPLERVDVDRAVAHPAGWVHVVRGPQSGRDLCRDDDVGVVGSAGRAGLHGHAGRVQEREDQPRVPTTGEAQPDRLGEAGQRSDARDQALGDVGRRRRAKVGRGERMHGDLVGVGAQP